jgi:hypothetical protein
MAKTVIGATIDIDVKNSSKSIDELNKEIEQLNQTLKESQENSELYQNALKKIEQLEAELAKKTKELAKETKSAGEESKKTGGAFGRLGGFIKGLGIVAGVTMAFGALREAFGRNQKTADTFSAVLITIQTIFNKFIEIITSVVDKVSKSTEGFDGLTKVLKGLLGIIGGSLKLAFSTIGLIIQEAQLAWEQSFFGDKDPESIKRLNASIEQSKKSIKEAATTALESGKQVVTNLGQAVVEVGQVVVGVVNEAQKIDGEFIKNTFNQSKALVELKNNAKIAAATLAGVRAESEREAELLRQQRDDQNKSLEERIAANEKLSEVLDKQRTASLALADQKIAAARVELAQNKGSVELQAALIESINERKDIEAQIAGLYSEQKANLVGLNLELKAREKAATEGANAVLLAEKKANAEIIQDELLKNEKLQQIRDEERKLELERLQGLIDIANVGTQARVDAEIAFNQKKQELDAADKVAANERAKIIRERALAETIARNENAVAEIALRKQLNDAARIDAIQKTELAIQLAKEETAALLEQLRIKRDAEIADAETRGLSTIEIKEKYRIQEESINNALAQSERDLADAKVEAQLGAAQTISGILGNIRGLVGEETKAGKAIAIAQASIDTYQAAWAAFKNAQKNPISIIGPAYPYIQAALAVAGGIANIRKIASVQVPGGGGGGAVPSISGAGAPPTAIAPTPTVTAQTLNAQAINNLGNQGMRAYVLNSDIQNNEQRNAYLQRNARIG